MVHVWRLTVEQPVDLSKAAGLQCLPDQWKALLPIEKPHIRWVFLIRGNPGRKLASARRKSRIDGDRPFTS